jgi:hypothetical protein
MDVDEIVEQYNKAEKDKTRSFAEWRRVDVFSRLIKPIFTLLEFNVDQINYEDKEGIVELRIREDLKAKVYISSLKEEQKLLNDKMSAFIDTLPDLETEKARYEISVVTNFETWYFYFDGREIFATVAERLEKDWDILKALVSEYAIETGSFKEIARKLLYKEDNEPLRQELNLLRVKIANRILNERINLNYLKNPDGTYNNELLNEIVTRWITRFLALKLAEDSGITFNFTLRDRYYCIHFNGSGL